MDGRSERPERQALEPTGADFPAVQQPSKIPSDSANPTNSHSPQNTLQC